MRSYSVFVCVWDDIRQAYVPDLTRSVWYDVPEGAAKALCCGASSDQKDIEKQQEAAYTQMTQQASQVFGDSSSVFTDLMSTFAPTLAAGPNQQGFSAAENANLNSQAITQTGLNYKNAAAAVGEAQAAQGGGNTGLTGGAEVGTDLGLASSAANQTANEENQITQANYATGRQNYELAAQGVKGSTDAFGASSTANNAATGGGTAASTTANQIAQENNSWIQSVTGALGGVAGAYASRH